MNLGFGKLQRLVVLNNPAPHLYLIRDRLRMLAASMNSPLCANCSNNRSALLLVIQPAIIFSAQLTRSI